MKFTFFLLLLLPLLVDGQIQPSLYSCRFTQDSIIIDGRLDDSCWNGAEWSNEFIDIEGVSKPKPYYKTRMKMLWDSSYLYVFVKMKDRHIWATLTNHDDIIYRDNDIEIFIDPDGDCHNYMEIEVNAHNTVLDLMMAKPYKNGGPLIMDWNPSGLKTAVYINGIINSSVKDDGYWTVEMAIPMKTLCIDRPKERPSPGDHWRVNFSRVQYDVDIDSTGYSKKLGASGRSLPEHNWVWSAQGQINMHLPEKWGYLHFNNEEGSIPAKFPIDVELRNILFKEYDRQKSKLVIEGRYRSQAEKTVTIDHRKYKLRTKASDYQFEITAVGKKRTWHLTDDRKIWITNN